MQHRNSTADACALVKRAWVRHRLPMETPSRIDLLSNPQASIGRICERAPRLNFRFLSASELYGRCLTVLDREGGQ